MLTLFTIYDYYSTNSTNLSFHKHKNKLQYKKTQLNLATTIILSTVILITCI